MLSRLSHIDIHSLITRGNCGNEFSFSLDDHFTKHAYHEHKYSYTCDHCRTHFPGEYILFCIHIKQCPVLCAEMEKVSGSSGATSASFSQMCNFLVFAPAFKKVFSIFVCNFWHFCLFLQDFELFFTIFCVLICKLFPSLSL